uniref:Uncharacterized protein n=1 Tax=Nelumbo nucifera TaxID=4432 RepID=A0A822ZJB5_NELNU|nr:TPA_asm: hypothetical protein HUJ06_003207 [Nelumbo nucifera]
MPNSHMGFFFFFFVVVVVVVVVVELSLFINERFSCFSTAFLNVKVEGNDSGVVIQLFKFKIAVGKDGRVRSIYTSRR